MTEAEWFASDWPDDLLEHVCSLRRAALGGTDSSEEDCPDFRPRVYPRKRRLFIAACCRRIWELLPTAGRNAVDVAEWFADGQVTDAQRIAAIAQVEAAGKAYFDNRRDSDYVWRGGWDALKAAGGALWAFKDGAYSQISCLADVAVPQPFLSGDFYDGGFGFTACHAVNALVRAEDDPDIAPLLGIQWAYLHPKLVAEEGHPVAGTRWHVELMAQCDLVRDLFGNPFRPIASDSTWLTPTVTSLAEAIYQERAFDRLPILADALEDAGCNNQDILLHCRGLGPHCRGCWVVDLLLGKE